MPAVNVFDRPPPKYNGTIHCNRSVEFGSQDVYVYTYCIIRYSLYNNSSNTLVNPSQMFFFFFSSLTLFIHQKEERAKDNSPKQRYRNIIKPYMVKYIIVMERWRLGEKTMRRGKKDVATVGRQRERSR